MTLEPHRLLQRQIQRYLGDSTTLPDDWQKFLAAVSDAYYQADGDRARIERTLELSSQELLQANTQMQSLLETVENQVAERTAELTLANAELATTLQELRETQGQLIQTEKMSSLGQLVAGVAHEINNPINFIHGNLNYASEYAQALLRLIQLYRKHYPNPVPAIQAEIMAIDLDFLVEDFTKLLKSMHIGSDRIKQIVLSLRNFSRIDEAEMKIVDLHDGIDSTLLILQHRLKSSSGSSGIEVIKQYGTLPMVECYAGQLNQVFMNLLANAIDAVESRFLSDKLDISALSTKGVKSQPALEAKIQGALRRAQPLTAIQNQTAPTIWICTESLSCDRILIRIADNGFGIPESLKQRLFDPFFTTKPIGKGTGLGLSISYQIVTKRHNGNLQCNSAPGLGTEFWVTIPTRQASQTAD
ncbi:MAG: sensor histidine kinase [Leptolyngbya sp.]|nr:MAG: sensor histidine kinase [Leptolyngbya sp.]